MRFSEWKMAHLSNTWQCDPPHMTDYAKGWRREAWVSLPCVEDRYLPTD